MAHVFATDSTRQRLQAAADAIEARSSAEIVIAVRAAATDMRAAALIGGTVCSFLGLLFSLFAPPDRRALRRCCGDGCRMSATPR